MNKFLKAFLIVLIVLIVFLAALAAIWVFLIYPRLDLNHEVDPGEDPMHEIEIIAKENAHIDYSEDNGQLYVNNEIVVVAAEGATVQELKALASKYGAEIDTAMSDIGIYKFGFSSPMTYWELEGKAEELRKTSCVEDAYLNLVSPVDGDEAVATELEGGAEKPPVSPNDTWNGDSWSTSVPDGENWGMEAIDAPGAWAYLSEMSAERIGLIDSMPDTAHSDLTFVNTSCLYIDTETGLTSTNKYTHSAADHGTHVSGIMSARWNNGVGVSGVMGGKGLLYYSAVYYDTKGTISARYATAYSYLLALKTLIDQDVQVINISQNTSRLVGFAASRGNWNAVTYLEKQATLAEKGLKRIIEARQAAGKSDFVICVAAGNSNATYYYKDAKEPYGYRTDMTGWESIKYLFGWRGECGDSMALYNNFLNLMKEDAVKSRVIVVGAVGIDKASSSKTGTRYKYTYYSNVGGRVDVVAPGGIPDESDIYSSVPTSVDATGYEGMCGTSMACPHAAGVAGLIFACNPNLTGPEVKEILMRSTTGRYTYTGGYSGLVNAKNAVLMAQETRTKSVKRVLKTTSNAGLDLCFVVDTTGSMEDDIDNAKANMTEILASLAEKTTDYRVALIDYRDYSSRTGDSRDYPCQVRLRFSSEDEEIRDAILDLDLGFGGDNDETVYSGLMAAVDLDWRTDAKKVIIILGDAAPLDPEPVTGYTYDQVLLSLFNADIALDYDESDSRVTDSLDDSLINVYSIGTGASSDAEDFFQELSEETGGSYSGVADAAGVSDAIVASSYYNVYQSMVDRGIDPTVLEDK